MDYQLRIGEQAFTVTVAPQQDAILRVTVNGAPYDVTIVQDGAASRPPAVAGATMREHTMVASAPRAAAADGALRAPIPGLIVEIKVRVGDRVNAGQPVAVMEAMKMENNLTAGVSGVVEEICVQKGSEVATGDVILRIG